MRVIPYILYLFFLAFHLTILKDITHIYGAHIDLAVLMVALVALYKSEMITFWFAACVAIISGTLRLDFLPWEMIILIIPALIVNQISTRINLESLTSRLILVAGFLLVHQAVLALIVSSEDFFLLLYKSILPTIIYSLIIGWLILQIFDGRITWKKIKALF